MQFKKATSSILKKLAIHLPVHLSYHSLTHTKQVYHSAKLLAQHENINPNELQLLLTAACYHDAGFLYCATGHEEASCQMVENDLPDFGYTPDDIKLICGMIKATAIPQKPQSHLEEILVDADLDYLGRSDFFSIADRLYQELLFSGMVKNELEWDMIQIAFIENHRYFTKTAINLRQEKKQSNLQKVKTRLKTKLNEL